MVDRKKKRDEYIEKLKQGCYIGLGSLPDATWNDRKEIFQSCMEEGMKDYNQQEIACEGKHAKDWFLKDTRTEWCLTDSLKKEPFDPTQYSQ